MKGVIASIHSYPLKSAGGVTLSGAEIRRSGFRWDRHWMLIDEANRFVSQRQIPELALLSATVSNGRLCVNFLNRPPLSVSENPSSQSERICATMHRADERIEVISGGDVASSWFTETLQEHSNQKVLRLVRMAPGFTRRIPDDPESETNRVELADGYPYLVTSNASLARLNDRLLEEHCDAPILEMKRFRPNIVLDLDEPWIEMRGDLVLRTADGKITFRLAKTCQRRGIPQIDPATSATDTGGELHRILKELGSGLKNPSNDFGQNAIPLDGIGETLKGGMEIELVTGGL